MHRPVAQLFQCGAELGHGHPVALADIDTAQEHGKPAHRAAPHAALICRPETAVGGCVKCSEKKCKKSELLALLFIEKIAIQRPEIRPKY